MEGFIMKKKPFITVETENLAVPEVHIDKEDVEETTDTDDTETITYDNVAVPEIHRKRKNK
jgi:hypothetical protein